MSRVPRLPAAALAIAIATGIAVGGCQAAPPPPTLTDPREILAAAVTTTTAAKAVRIDASADGTLGLDVLGTGAPVAVELTGTTASADLDLAAGGARVTFSAPGLLGLTGELIVVDGTTYLKSTLTGPMYRAQPIGRGAPEPSGGASAAILEGLTGLLANPALDPVKAEDGGCGNTTCYRVEMKLTPADLAAVAADLQAPTGLPVPIPVPDVTAATVDLTVLVTRDTTRLAGLTTALDLGADGSASLQLTFSKWDDAVSISAPPQDQVAPGG